jgi:uncharacterized membrane protein YqjE
VRNELASNLPSSGGPYCCRVCSGRLGVVEAQALEGVTVILEDRPKLRFFLRLALLLALLAFLAAVIDLLYRLAVPHPNLAGIIVLLILAAIFFIQWNSNR